MFPRLPARAYVMVLVDMLVLATCAPQPQANLGATLTGVRKATFLDVPAFPGCMTQRDWGEVTFLTNRTQDLDPVGPAAMPVASCSGNATFHDSSLTNASFWGIRLSADVFAPSQVGKGC